MRTILGVVRFRRGEIENSLHCVGPSSRILPVSLAAVHMPLAGSRQAIEHFTAYLKQVPGDLRVRWILNLAYMTLGECSRHTGPLLGQHLLLNRTSRPSCALCGRRHRAVR